MGELPPVDEHAVTVDAPPERVWAALGAVLGGSFGSSGSRRFARLVGCRETESRGSILERGGAIPGFRVASARPDRELALEGTHRFSRYSLTFHLEPAGVSRTRLAAETRAAFPGLHGRAYRAAVIGTRGHVVVTRRLLRRVRDRAVDGDGVAGYR